MKTVRDIQVKTLKSHQAMGTLVAIEGEKELPIPLNRVFYVFGAQENTLRGEHAHKECTQVLICVNGTCEVECHDGLEKRTFNLTRGDQYLLIPPGIWASERYNEKDTVLLVLADKSYDPKDYIRDFDTYINWRGVRPAQAA